SIDSEILLKRGKTGKGYIKAKEANILKMPFMTPKDEIAAFSKRDSIQHPFLDDLYNWGDNLTHFYFGTQLGKDVLVAVIKDKEKKAGLDLKNTDMVVAKFIEGEEKFGKQFVDTIKSNMEEIGYKTDNIEVGPLKSILFMGEGASKPMGINVKEADLSGITDQHSMSQGMFRALSLVIQITFSLMADIPSCILIDDIGEGLDYERSSNLLRVLIKKAMHKNVQLIMTTNDRFVMNNVPLEYWSVIRRIGNRSAIYNYQNSKKMFTSFELTGLSNFDFFSSNYLLQE
ncbi:MAG TPA: AAA family ATPase, partial [Candidatus Babeliales bacterium]|nr:AAA family ATPase [Candidatus Babeliales bacterium]